MIIKYKSPQMGNIYLNANQIFACYIVGNKLCVDPIDSGNHWEFVYNTEAEAIQKLENFIIVWQCALRNERLETLSSISDIILV